jgi:hypothetical protein
MNTPIVLAEMYGGILILVGLTALNKKYLAAVFQDIAGSTGLMWITGFVTFLIGIVSLALYSAWSSDWHVVVTVAGWATLIKGAVLTLSPQTSTALYRKTSSHTIWVGGIVGIILGAILLYLALTAG